MRTCPKEEETVETCDGMNQKNTIFDNLVSNKLKNEKNYKRKKEIKDFRNSYEKEKLIFLFISLAMIGFLGLDNEKEFFSFPKVCNTFGFFIGVIDFIG
ncbi:hypothetical protein [Prochlorococcus marinus]|uniref:hypothetical protein n=1 Tax=Prochlorococcus marinus TaxID=1219 RepID=UPI0022B3BAEE|nr:hypothetical protein [Prochlorococcus marinus]